MSGVSWIILANLLGGVSYVATHWALEGFSPLEIVFWRTMVALPLVFPFFRGPRLSREDLLRILAVGAFGYTLPLLMAAEGQRHSSATLAAILVGTEPVCTLLLACFVLGERLTPVKGLAMATGLGGAVLITLQGRMPEAGALTAEARGNLLLALQGLCWALYTVVGKPVMQRVEPVRFSGSVIAVSLLPLLALSRPGPAEYFGLGEGLSLSRAAAAPFKAWASVLFLGAGVSVLGTAAWNFAMKSLTASKIAQFIFLQPVIGIAVGYAAEGKPLSAWSLAGTALIAASIYASALEPEEAGVPAKE